MSMIGRRAAPVSMPARVATTWLVYLMPFLETFNIAAKLSHHAPAPGSEEFAAIWSYTGWAGLYALAYVAFILLIGVLLMRRREIT